jgi:transcriptional regulator with XRE-family HTH domain
MTSTGKEIMQLLGPYLKHKRLHKGMTLSQLAFRAGLSKSMVSQVENGLNSISLQSLIALSQILHVDLNEVLRRKIPQRCPTCKGDGFVRN